MAILQAALRVIGSKGFGKLTVDAVAKEAGLSKGGIFHYFKSKDTLLAGLIEHYSRGALQVIQTRISQMGEHEKAKPIRAMISAAFPELAADASAQEDHQFLRAHRDFMMGVITAGILSPELMRTLKEMRLKMSEDILANEESGEDQLLLWLAMDGLWLWRMLGLVEEGDDQWKTISRLLLARSEKLSGKPKRKR